MSFRANVPRTFTLALVSGLTACGGGQSGSGDVTIDTAAPAPAATPAPDPTPMPTPAPSPTPTPTPPPATSSEQPFADFDFARGTRYPGRAQVSVKDISYPVGASSVNVPVALDGPTPNTVIVRVLTKNGTGSDYAYQGHNFKRVDRTVIFRPGDPLVQTVRIPILRSKDGQSFRLIFPDTPIGASSGHSTAVLTASANAQPTPVKTEGFREPRQFAPSGDLKYDLAPAQMRWSNKGGPGVWSTKLSHGRTQPGNAETGLYLDKSIFPDVEAPFRIDRDDLVIHSQKLTQRISYKGKSWRYGAAILTGQRMPQTQVQYGQYEWAAKMPNRRGSWPAFWFIGVNGWPPELDLYEGFGYGSGWNFSTDISGAIHGGPRGIRNFAPGVSIDAKAVFGIDGLDTGFHRYAVDIQPDYITWFLDGRETYQAVNPFHEEAWYPLMNIAVKTDRDYTDGNGDMVVRSFRVWE